MGRKGSIPVGTGFMPGTSTEDLYLLGNKKDTLTPKRYAAAYHRKMGSSFKEIGYMVRASPGAVGTWLVAMHKGGLEAAPRRKRSDRR